MNIATALERWLQDFGRKQETKRAYRRAVQKFMIANKMNAEFDVEKINHTHYIKFVSWLNRKEKSGQTRAQYATGVLRFFDFLILLDLSSVNIPKCRIAKRDLLETSEYHLRQYIEEDVNDLLADVEMPIEHLFGNDEKAKLRAFRDRAFILSIASSGMRVREARDLKRGQIDWTREQAVIIGKGDKQAVIRFSTLAMNAIKEYLDERAELDGASGKPLLSLPVFAQHSRSSSNKVNPITTKTGRDILKNWVLRVLGDKKKAITPHTLRHKFVNDIIDATGNIKTAKEMARHESIGTTDRYAQLKNKELDQVHDEIFNRPRR